MGLGHAHAVAIVSVAVRPAGHPAGRLDAVLGVVGVAPLRVARGVPG
jgi:hypothetical protein